MWYIQDNMMRNRGNMIEE